MKRIFVFLGLCVALALGAGAARAETLVMGLIPAENNEEMVRQFEPMRQYLEAKLAMDIKVYTATDYSGVIEAMRRKRIDVAWFGPMSYYLAEIEAGAVAFAVGVRASSGKSSYRSIFVVPEGSPATSILDLEGKNVAFVDPASTSGGLVPTYVVKKATGRMPEDFFGKLIYAGSHDAALLAVKNKTVDAAASNDITYWRMVGAGLIDEVSDHIIAYSGELPGAPLVYRADLDGLLKKRIQDAFIYAHTEIEVTGYGNLERYEPVGPADYAIIRDMVRELELKKENLLE